MGEENAVTTPGSNSSGNDYSSVVGNADWLNGRMTMFDTRLYRNLILFNENMEGDDANDGIGNFFYPHFDYGSYVTDFYETPTSIQNMIEETKNSDQTADEKKVVDGLQARKTYIDKFIQNNQKQYLAPRSFIHPYALVKLTGASGDPAALKNVLTYDQYNKRKFYEVDGEQEFSGNYSKTPTTTTLIKWGNESPRNKTPYSFQDFVFCKYWNKIENNRLITLRRYAAPVTDNIEFPDYNISNEAPNSTESTELQTTDGKGGSGTYKGSLSKNPWTPLATAVTYFGEDTGNKLSDLLSFSAHYRWKEIGNNDKNPIDISSTQNDAGSGLVNDSFSGLTTGLGLVAKVFGFFGEVNGNNVINLEGAPQSLPPDPYKDGPYENRILGPVNVITNTWRRDRGLEFKQDGLKLTFEYVARPIAGINSKAVLLDLMSNILLLTYSNGSWYGGMWRYNAERPAIYPWKFGDTMNKLYKGEIFGRNGFVLSLTKNVYREGTSYLSTFLPDAAKFVTNLFKGAMNKIMELFTGDKSRGEAAAANFNEVLATGTSHAIQKVIAAKALKGTTVPYLKNQRALLTGEPIGDWHLTIGNPLNPIAMIGNLICKDVKFEFSDELGPDDFPIGFKAIITLDHGLGRDREAIESMFNRGYGRIYTLSKEFRSSADGETKVDDNTGGVNTDQGRVKYDETRNTYFGGGTRFIAKIQQGPLANRGKMYLGGTRRFESLKPTNTMSSSYQASTYYVNSWQMAMSL